MSVATIGSQYSSPLISPSPSRWSVKTGIVILGIISLISVIAYYILFQKIDSFSQENFSTTVAGAVAGNMWQSHVCANISRDYILPSTLPTSDILGISQTTLLNTFENIEAIGKGGYGEVFRVHDKMTKRKYALKIFTPLRTPHSYEAIKTSTSFLLDHGITPHLTRCYETRPITEKDNEPVRKGQLAEKHMLLTELLEGDMSKNLSLFSLEQRLTFELQNRHTVDTLKRLFNIVVEDNQLKNRFFVTLSDQHYFRGRRLADFSFWKYRFKGIDVFIPKPIHLLELGDYDNWGFPLVEQEDSSATDHCTTLDQLSYDTYWAAYSSLRTQNILQKDVLPILEKWTQEPNEEFLDMD